MRLITAILLFAVATVSACKDEVKKSDTLGKFDISIDGTATEVASYTGPEIGRSGIMVVKSGGVKILIVEGASGVEDDGQPILPLLSVTLISDSSGENFNLDTVRYTLEDGGNVYATDGNTGQKMLSNLVLQDGDISFDLSVDLIAHAPNSAGRTVLQDVAPIHIEGRFFGSKTFEGIND